MTQKRLVEFEDEQNEKVLVVEVATKAVVAAFHAAGKIARLICSRYSHLFQESAAIRIQSIRSWRYKGSDPSQLVSLLSIHGKAYTTKLFTYKELEKATKRLAPSEKLGNAARGTVYAGKLPNGCLVDNTLWKCLGNTTSYERS